MNCPLCRDCTEADKAPGRCIYGGPFSGFMKSDDYYRGNPAANPPPNNPRYWMGSLSMLAALS